MLGYNGVGKSAISIQFAQQYFRQEASFPFEDDDHFSRQAKIYGKIVQVDIMDFLCEREYREHRFMREFRMLDADGFVIVYAINSRRSFQEVREDYEHILRVKDCNKFPIVVVGNKCDLPEEQRRVTTEEGFALCAWLQVPFFEISAKAGINIEEAFFELVREIQDPHDKKKKGSNYE